MYQQHSCVACLGGGGGLWWWGRDWWQAGGGGGVVGGCSPPPPPRPECLATTFLRTLKRVPLSRDDETSISKGHESSCRVGRVVAVNA